MMKSTQPVVSIIVHTKNSEKTLEEHLKSIVHQSYRSIEIVAVDNFSTDATQEILRKYTKKVFEKGPERSAQRNFGVKKALGKYVLIPDSDMQLSKGVVEECVALAEKDKKIKAIVIPERSFGKGFWASCKILERRCYEHDSTIEAARFFDRTLFQAVGGYDEQITGPEDWDLPQRISKKGYQIGRIHSYILHDEGELHLSTLMKKKYYYGIQLRTYLKKHPFRTNLSQTIYFLRPAFYRNWRLLLSQPITALGMMIMLFSEQCAGFLGYMKGRIV